MSRAFHVAYPLSESTFVILSQNIFSSFFYLSCFCSSVWKLDFFLSAGFPIKSWLFNFSSLFSKNSFKISQTSSSSISGWRGSFSSLSSSLEGGSCWAFLLPSFWSLFFSSFFFLSSLFTATPALLYYSSFWILFFSSSAAILYFFFGPNS